MKTNMWFNNTFRRIPNVYKKRKSYHKAFQYLKKVDPAGLTMINTILIHMHSFSYFPDELTKMIKKYYTDFMDTPYSKKYSVVTFLQNIISDISYKNSLNSYFADIIDMQKSDVIVDTIKCMAHSLSKSEDRKNNTLILPFMDVASLYPQIMVNYNNTFIKNIIYCKDKDPYNK